MFKYTKCSEFSIKKRPRIEEKPMPVMVIDEDKEESPSTSCAPSSENDFANIQEIKDSQKVCINLMLKCLYQQAKDRKVSKSAMGSSSYDTSKATDASGTSATSIINAEGSSQSEESKKDDFNTALVDKTDEKLLTTNLFNKICVFDEYEIPREEKVAEADDVLTIPDDITQIQDIFELLGKPFQKNDLDDLPQDDKGWDYLFEHKNSNINNNNKYDEKVTDERDQDDCISFLFPPKKQRRVSNFD